MELAEVWMFLDFIIRVLLETQHQVSSIQHLHRKRSRLKHIGNDR